MPTLEEQWQTVTADPRYDNLDEPKRKRVADRFFDQYVRSEARYQDLPESKRITVRQRFDQMVTPKQEDFGSKAKRWMRQGVEQAKRIPGEIEAGKKILESAPGPVGRALSTPLRIQDAGYGALGKVAGAVEKGADIAGDIIEPSEKRLGRLNKELSGKGIIGTVEALANPLTQFDLARAIGSGAVRTLGKFAAGVIPTSQLQLGEWVAADGFFRVLGKIPLLGKVDILAPFKRKLPIKPPVFEETIENSIAEELLNQRSRSTANPRPLEVLANEEAKIEAKKQYKDYQDWLERTDKLSPQGGEPSGDLYPPAKVNVSQLRDAARDRLKTLQDEPVRVESLGAAEDELKGYFRRRLDLFPPPGSVIELGPSSVPRETTPMLEGGPKPAGLLKAGTPGEAPSGPPTARPPTEPGPGALPGSPSGSGGPAGIFPTRPSLQSISQEPEFVKLSQSAEEIVTRHARARGVQANEKFAIDLYHELHDALGEIKSAAPKDKAAVAQDLMRRYPKLETDFRDLWNKLQTDRYPKFFDKHIRGSPEYAAPAPAPAAPQGPLPPQAFGEMGIKGYKAFVNQTFRNRLPGEAKEVIDRLTGTLMKTLTEKQWINQQRPAPLGVMMQNMIEQLIDQSIPVLLEETKPDAVRLREKGLDPAEVMALAKQLQSQHETERAAILDQKRAFKDAFSGIAMQDPDPMTGKIPEREEYLRNVPPDMRGPTKPDAAAQMAFDAGLIKSPDVGTLYQALSKLGVAGPSRSMRSFMDEAERQLEHELHVQSGMEEELKFPPATAIPPSEPVMGTGEQTRIPGTERKFGENIQKKSGFDLANDAFKGMGEHGGFGGEIDPVERARRDEAIRELVRRARAIGYDNAQDIMLWAAKNAPLVIRDEIRKHLAATVTPFDSHAYKEMDEARAGNPAARQAIKERAQRSYLVEKAKGIYRKLKLNQQLLQFKDGDEATMRLKNEFFIHDTYRGHNKYELAAQRWHNEGRAPKREALAAIVGDQEVDKYLDAYRNPSARVKAAKPSTQAHEDEWHDLFSQFYDEFGYVENHVTRRWKQPKEYLNWEGRVLQNRPNFMRGRKLLTQADGINAGYIPESLDIRDDLRASNNFRVFLLSRIHMLRKIGMSFTADGDHAIISEAGEGQGTKAKIALQSGQAPNHWLRYRNVSLLNGLAIHPDFKPALDYMLSQRSVTKGAQFMDWLAASSKANFFFLSTFHGLSLSEMLLTGASFRDVFTFNMNRNLLAKTLRTISKGAKASLENPLTWRAPTSKEGMAHNMRSIARFYDSYMKGAASLANRPLALDMAEQGFRHGPVTDETNNMVSRNLRGMEDWLKRRSKGVDIPGAASNAIKEIRSINDIHAKTLWSYIHEGFSMAIYENQLADNIRTFNIEAPEGKKIPVDQIKRDTADFVSKEMGGLSYSRLFINPRMQQILQWAMLAPAWTIGRVWMATDVAKSGPEGRQSRKQLLRIALGYYVTANIANYANTKRAFGKGRFLWENPEGQKLNIFWRVKRGKEEDYVQGSKASTEVIDDLDHPARTAAGKLSGPIQAAVKIVNWARLPEGEDRFDAANPLKALLGMATPGYVTGMSAYGALPVRKGITRSVIAHYLDEFYKTKDRQFFIDASRFGREAGIDVKSLDAAARARATHRKNLERKALLQ